MIVEHESAKADGEAAALRASVVAKSPARDFIERNLRAAFHEVENEPLPQALETLLRRLRAEPKILAEERAG